MRSLERKQTSLEDVVVTAESTALQQDVQEEWDGLTVLHPNMAAECREQQM